MQLNRHVCACALALLATFPSSTWAAGASTVRAYPLPSGGSLELTVPMRWREEIAWGDGASWPTLQFLPAEGSEFAISVTAVAPEAGASHERTGAQAPERVRALVEASARAALGVGDDEPLMLRELDGPQGPGWLYSVTDAAIPDPAQAGTFRVMTQGTIAVDDVLLSATILTQTQSSEELHAGLEMLRTAKLSTQPGDAWRAPTQSHVDRGGAGQRYTFDPPEDFVLERTSPLEARDARTGGLLVGRVEMRASDPPSELQGLARILDLRSPDGWLLRHRGKTIVDGRPAAELVATDEHRDQAVHLVAIPRKDWVLVLEWRVDPSMATEGSQRMRAALAGIRFKDE